MYVKCPICDEQVDTEHMEELTEALRGHLAGVHDVKVPELPLRRGEYCEGGTSEERAVETFSGTDVTKLPEKDRADIERVAEFREPRAMETEEERATRTFSGRERTREPADVQRMEQAVEQFKEPRAGETEEERATRTFSGIDYEKAPARSTMLREEVRQFKYPRTGPECERGPGAMPQKGGVVHQMMSREGVGFEMDCPLCDTTLHGETEEDLSSQLKQHYQANH